MSGGRLAEAFTPLGMITRNFGLFVASKGLALTPLASLPSGSTLGRVGPLPTQVGCS
jgi:hypothetical protein